MAPRVWQDVDELLRYLAENWPFDPDEMFEPKLISPNAQLPDGDSPLHLVAQWDDARGIQLLAAAGANLDHQGDMEITPLGVAVGAANLAAVRALLALGASSDLRDGFGRTPRERARSSDVKELRELFE
jgi:ankyrin repeat protein